MQIKTKSNDVIWSYLGSFFQYCTTLLILPIILTNLEKAELGLWYTFSSVGTLVMYLDFGFSTTLVRNITYAWSGAKKIQKEGINPEDIGDAIDAAFINRILAACRLICLVVAFIALVIMASVGTWYISYVSRDLSGNNHIIAWLIYAMALFLNLYYNYCGNALRGIGKISEYQKIVVLSRILQILVSFLGIQLGFGLIALSAAYLISGFSIRVLSNYQIKNALSTIAKDAKINELSLVEKLKDTKEIFLTIWFNAKRTGIISLCSYATNQSLTLICSAYLGVEETASYGLCLQIITAIMSVAGIAFATFSPQMISQIATNDKLGYKKTFNTCIFVFWILSISMCFAFGVLSKPVLAILGSQTDIPVLMFGFMSVYMFLEHNHGEYTAFFTMKNEIIYMVPYIISSFSIAAGSLLVAIRGGNIYMLMCVHFVVQLLYNNWKWPKKAMEEMETSFFETIRMGYKEIIHIGKRIVQSW